MSAPDRALGEMVRVTVPSGRIAVVDLVAPDAAGEHAAYDEIERLRDPSHTRTFTRRQFEEMLASAGLTVQSCDLRDLQVDPDDWLAKAQTPPRPAAQVRAALQAELEGGRRTGMRPFHRDGRLMLHQVWGTFVARRR
jgi:hypothetical protein